MICNGIEASIDLLDSFVDALDPRIEVVSFDVPGAGGSPHRCPDNFPVLAWFLGRMLDRLGYDEFDIFGISWGGGLRDEPELARTLLHELAPAAADFLLS